MEGGPNPPTFSAAKDRQASRTAHPCPCPLSKLLTTCSWDGEMKRMEGMDKEEEWEGRVTWQACTIKKSIWTYWSRRTKDKNCVCRNEFQPRFISINWVFQKIFLEKCKFISEELRKEKIMTSEKYLAIIYTDGSECIPRVQTERQERFAELQSMKILDTMSIMQWWPKNSPPLKMPSTRVAIKGEGMHQIFQANGLVVHASNSFGSSLMSIYQAVIRRPSKRVMW